MVRESINVHYISNLSSGPGDLNLEELKGEVIQIIDQNTLIIKITDLFDYEYEEIQVDDNVIVKSHLVLLSPYIHPDYSTPSRNYQIKTGDVVSFYASDISDENGINIIINDYLSIKKAIPMGRNPTGCLLHDGVWHIRALKHSAHPGRHRSLLFVS